jgi:hypothetical protein
MRKATIIGLCGKATVGKDTVADYLVREHGFEKAAFAAPLKDVAAQLFGWPRAALDDAEAKQRVDAFWGLSPRTALQRLGTDCIREQFGADFWIKTLERRYLQRGEADSSPLRLVVADVRFPNEADAIKRWGGALWRLEGPSRGRDGALLSGDNAAHASETALDHFAGWDSVLQNVGTLEMLHAEIEARLE